MILLHYLPSNGLFPRDSIHGHGIRPARIAVLDRGPGQAPSSSRFSGVASHLVPQISGLGQPGQICSSAGP
jgi:hypothetical protein